MGRVVCLLDAEAAAQRDAGMLAAKASGAAPLPPLQPPVFAAGCILPGAPGAGAMFPQPSAGDGARRLRLDDLLGNDAWLLSRKAVIEPAHSARVLMLDADVLAPFRVALAAWFDRQGVDAVLVRPDRYVFGAGDPDRLLKAWAQGLAPLRRAA
jgi:3-(3-hydroxy-phenyl)propionate hydroxylase